MNQTNNSSNKRTTASKPTPKKKPQKNQVSLAGVAKTPAKGVREERRPFPWKLVVFGVVLILLMLGGMMLYWLISGNKSEQQSDKKALTAREMVEYAYTPDNLAGDVSY